MKTNNILTIALLSVLSFVAVSCDDGNEDTQRPTIDIISPANDGVVTIGDAAGMAFSAKFMDNDELSSYDIDIHYNDGHSHGRHAGEHETTNFSFKRSWDLSGKEQTVNHREIVIPADATPGEYHLVVICYDVSGNESMAYIDIVLE